MVSRPGYRPGVAATLEIDAIEVERAAQALITKVLTAARLSIRANTRGLEQDLEALTRAAVPGRLWRAWGSQAYPRGNVNAYDPAGEVFINGKARSIGAMTYWSEPGVNRAKSGGYLAVPTEFAGPNTRSRSLTPGEWERRNGIRLHFVYRGGGKPSLLMARQVLFGANGSGVRAVTVRRMKNKKYANADFSAARTRDVPIFVLIPLQRFANRFSVEPAIAARKRKLVADFEGRLARAVR